MKLFLQLIIPAFILIFTVSCKSATKMYQKGNYDEAVEIAARKLQKDPGDPKLTIVLEDAYKYAVTDHMTRIRSLEKSGNELRYEKMYQEYASLQRLHDVIFRSPSVYHVVKPSDYRQEMDEIAVQAADVRYQRGIQFMKHYDKQSYRNAYREFQHSLRLRPGDTETMQRMQEAYAYAVTNVVVLPIQQARRFSFSQFRDGYSSIDDQLMRSLRNGASNEFLQFYTAHEADFRNIRTDMIMDLRLTNVYMGAFNDQTQTRKVSKEVVVKEIVYRPDSIVKVYDKIHAEVHSTQRMQLSSARLVISTREPNGRSVWSEQIESQYKWETRFANYTGDERALSEEDRKLIQQRRENPPAESEIAQCLMEDIGSRAQNVIRNRMRRL